MISKVKKILNNSTKAQAAIFCLIALLVLCLHTGFGALVLSPDSLAYLQTANTLAQGGGFFYGNGLAYQHWPPLFPVLLAGFLLIKISAAKAALLINIASHLLTVGLGFLLINQTQPHFTKKLPALICLLFALPHLFVQHFLWTEPLFIFFIAYMFYQINKQQQTYLTFALGTLTRYVGVYMLPVLILKNIKKPKYWLYYALALLPLAGWLAYNYYLTGHPMGARTPSTGAHWVGLVAAIQHFVNTFNTWWLPGELADQLRWVGWLWPLLFAMLLLASVLHYASHSTQPFKCYLAVFILVFWAGIMATGAGIKIDPPDMRLLSPSFLPMLLWLNLHTRQTKWAGQLATIALWWLAARQLQAFVFWFMAPPLP